MSDFWSNLKTSNGKTKHLIKAPVKLAAFCHSFSRVIMSFVVMKWWELIASFVFTEGPEPAATAHKVVKLGRGDALLQHIPWTAPIPECFKGCLTAVPKFSPSEALGKTTKVVLLRISLLVQQGLVCILCSNPLRTQTGAGEKVLNLTFHTPIKRQN